ncbi:membrane protein insertion efficiency factor YidD [bacterium]|nr:membrane protein insertion efficiency factor YidD [bacterium]MBU1652977.1 membrane protein insertion efficiency factor YidD [bacterium]
MHVFTRKRVAHFLALFVFLLLFDSCAYNPTSIVFDSPSEPSSIGNNDSGFFDYADKSIAILIGIHQNFITDIDDHSCPMYPTCSKYGSIAINKQGFLLGSLMVYDRLLRCGHDLHFYERVLQEGHYLYEDLP